MMIFDLIDHHALSPWVFRSGIFRMWDRSASLPMEHRYNWLYATFNDALETRKGLLKRVLEAVSTHGALPRDLVKCDQLETRVK